MYCTRKYKHFITPLHVLLLIQPPPPPQYHNDSHLQSLPLAFLKLMIEIVASHTPLPNENVHVYQLW
jgi:hypothetical protein